MSQQNRQTVLPYSEEQVTHWLSFLARRMTEHDQTIFLIEKLQPSWLSSPMQYIAYSVLSRLIWASLVGLTISSTFWSLDFGLTYGLTYGMIAGAVDSIFLFQRYSFRTPSQIDFLRSLWMVLQVLVLSITLVVARVLGSDGNVFFGYILVIIWLLRFEARDQYNEIKILRTINIDFDRVIRSFMTIHAYAAMFIIMLLVTGPMIILIMFFTNEIKFAIAASIVFLSIIMLISIELTKLHLSDIPIQGNQSYLYSSFLMGSIGGLLVGLVVLLFSNLTNGLIYCVLSGTYIGLWYGGLDVIQHFIVRFLLWRAGSLPWRLAPFLDYAAEELHFLQKVGGGYIFVHRYLLEHFAAMETDDGRPRTADHQTSDAG